MTGRDPLDQLIVVDTLSEKYRYRDEPDWAATCARVVGALCKNEGAEFMAQARRAMIAREIVPAGRILAGAGTDKRVTLINCFVGPRVQDSMATEPGLPGKGIMDALSDSAYSLQMGGGIGTGFSTIRPRGALVRRTASVSSGVLPFMDMWHYMSETIMSAGHRRGAMMATLRCDHPDILEFIEAKQQPDRLTNFNISVLVTDAFMRAVESDSHWHLVFEVPCAKDASPEPLPRDRGVFEHVPSGTRGYVYKTLRARDLWDKIVGNTYVHAEPGVIFIDRVNALNNLAYCEEIHACNPCGEQMLPDNGCCNLGHTNLAVMVDRLFEPGAEFLFDKLQTAARTMVRLLDNVLDETLWPTSAQAEEARLKRRIGLGFTGLGTALQQLGIPYGSNLAVEFTREVARAQAVAAYWASVELARERGPFPLYDREKFLAAPFVRKLPDDLRDAIAEHGIRNGVLLSIAPTGTTSLVLGNVSSGIEPVFAHRYQRKVRGGNGQMEGGYSVYDYGYLLWCQLKGMDPETTYLAGHRPPGFVTADQLTVEQHLRMAAAAQEWVDSAVSKTINCPTSMTFEEFKGVYARAYELGMKGCTTYRPDPRSGRGAVLTVESGEEVVQSGKDDEEGAGKAAREGGEAREEARAKEEVARPAPLLDKIPMQDVVEGRRYRIRWPTEDCAYYVIITDYIGNDGLRRPFELFISTKSERHSEWVRAFSLLVTAIFRREGDPTFVVEELRSVFSAAGGAWVKVPWADRPKLAPSLVAAVGLKIEEHMRWLGLIAPDEAPLVPGHTDLMISPEAIDAALSREELMPSTDLLDVCIHCGARAVVYSEGCSTCYACGKSDCG